MPRSWDGFPFRFFLSFISYPGLADRYTTTYPNLRAGCGYQGGTSPALLSYPHHFPRLCFTQIGTRRYLPRLVDLARLLTTPYTRP